MSIHALVQMSSEVAEQSSEPEISPFVYGGTALVVLFLLLFIVTRFNINR